MSLIQRIKPFARPSGAVAVTAAGPALGALVALGLAVTHADTLREGGLGIGALLLVGGALAVGLAVLPTHVLSLVSGWALGLPLGLAVALVAATLGSPVGYGLGRWLAGPGLNQIVRQNPRAAAACDAITRASPLRAAWLVALLRLSPVVPYGSMNALAAALAVPLMPFVAGTLIGLAPRVAAVVALGAGLEQLDDEREVPSWLLITGITATLLAVVVMGVIAKRALVKAINQPQPLPPPQPGSPR